MVYDMVGVVNVMIAHGRSKIATTNGIVIPGGALTFSMERRFKYGNEEIFRKGFRVFHQKSFPSISLRKDHTPCHALF